MLSLRTSRKVSVLDRRQNVEIWRKGIKLNGTMTKNHLGKNYLPLHVFEQYVKNEEK